MKRFLFAMLALVLAVGCGGADKKEKKAEKSDEGKQVDVDIAYKVGDYYNENGKQGDIAYKVGDHYNENGKQGDIAYKVGDYYNENGKQGDIAYKVGDYYNENGKQGVVFAVWDNGRHGKIVSLDETLLQWCEYDVKLGFANKSDGKANTDKVMSSALSEYFEAFVWCRNKGADWYLPAINELIAISINKSAINSTLAKYGTKLDKYNDGAYYWSSTESEDWLPESCAWIVGMHRVYYYVSNKDASRYVRAVSAF